MRKLGVHESWGALETLSPSPLASHPTPAYPFSLVLILCPWLTLPWCHRLVLCVRVRVWCCGGGSVAMLRIVIFSEKMKPVMIAADCPGLSVSAPTLTSLGLCSSQRCTRMRERVRRARACVVCVCVTLIRE